MHEEPLPPLADGEVLVRNHLLSLDPYMRSRMDEQGSYAEAQELGEVMMGGTAGVVVESRNPRFKVGDPVIAQFGWQLFGLSDGKRVRKVDTSVAPLSAYLGVLGMPGVTAWYGLKTICRPRAGQTLVVSAAAGAVGSVVAQLARLAGARVVGVAGGAAKCSYLINQLGLDAAVDYKCGQLEGVLADATPDGIDCLFENVGGAVFDASLGRMNQDGRVAVCGLVAGYNDHPIPLFNVRAILNRRLTLQGFIVSDHMEQWGAALAELTGLVKTGVLKYRETVISGLANAPAAFMALLAGHNLGKQLVALT
jgi:NADPH-dependent curcumin reductase